MRIKSVEYIGTVDQRRYVAGNGYETERICLTNMCTISNIKFLLSKMAGWPSKHSAGQKIKMNYIEYLTHIAPTWETVKLNIDQAKTKAVPQTSLE